MNIIIYLLLFVIFFVFRFDGLVMRFEAPVSKNRWDSPLFSIAPSDELPCQEIYDALFLRKAPPPNLSTVSVSDSIHVIVAGSWLKERQNHEIDVTREALWLCILVSWAVGLIGCWSHGVQLIILPVLLFYELNFCSFQLLEKGLDFQHFGF